MRDNRIRAVLFDLDGTLVESNEAHVEVWAQVFAEAGHAIEREAIRGQIGKGGDQLVPALIPGASEDLVEKLSDRHGDIFKADRLDRIRPFPQARALLERVREAELTIVLASSASKAELDYYVGLLEAKPLIDASTSIDDVETSKPAPDIFAAALKKAGVAADEAVAVGDTPYDIASAGKAGIATIALRSGGFSDDALARALAIYDDAAALLANFDRSPLRADLHESIT